MMEPEKNHWLLWEGILIILALIGVVWGSYWLFKNQTRLSLEKKLSVRAVPSLPVPSLATEQSKAEYPEEEICLDEVTGNIMSLPEARQIALESECGQQGNLTGGFFCNDSTGTWWLDLGIEKLGCNPACVVSVATKGAEINWRCTGLKIESTPTKAASGCGCGK